MKLPAGRGLGRPPAGWGWFAVAVLAAGCAPEPKLLATGLAAPSQPASVAALVDLPGWPDDNQAEALPALAASCTNLATLPPEHDLGGHGTAGPARHMQRICAELDRTSITGAQEAREFLERWFVPVHHSGESATEGLFTGYFEPEVAGRRTPVPGAEPLYVRPPELVEIDLGSFRPALSGTRLAGRVQDGELVPMPDRASIQQGALAGRNLELVWILDPVEAFFLHIQGSGRVRLADGSVMHVGYAGFNGHPYYAIGRTLLRRGAIDLHDLSLQSIAAWLRAHPKEMRALMAENASFVFFEERAASTPVGAAGVPLTPRRSIAVDREYIPLHMPVWIQTRVPVPGGGDAPVARLMLAQDTGAAIRGPARGDLFFGHGALAREQAGRMRAPGRAWVLVPRSYAHEVRTPD